jgi:hypothetical protein
MFNNQGRHAPTPLQAGSMALNRSSTLPTANALNSSPIA